MKIQCWSVGKNHESYVKEGIETFSKRIAHYFPVSWTIIPMPKDAGSLKEADLKNKEAAAIFLQLQKEDHLILLEETGKELSSPELAVLIQKKADAGIKSLVFLIGGAFGVSDEIKKRADFTWSLSKLVFPHQLVRLILAEQVYRACTILRNEKYHHS